MGGKVGRERCPLISPKYTPEKERGLFKSLQGTQGRLGDQRFVGGEAFLVPRWKQPEVPELAPGAQH